MQLKESLWLLLVAISLAGVMIDSYLRDLDRRLISYARRNRPLSRSNLRLLQEMQTLLKKSYFFSTILSLLILFGTVFLWLKK
jgi:hypothetical protein